MCSEGFKLSSKLGRIRLELRFYSVSSTWRKLSPEFGRRHCASGASFAILRSAQKQASQRDLVSEFRRTLFQQGCLHSPLAKGFHGNAAKKVSARQIESWSSQVAQVASRARQRLSVAKQSLYSAQSGENRRQIGRRRRCPGNKSPEVDAASSDWQSTRTQSPIRSFEFGTIGADRTERCLSVDATKIGKNGQVNRDGERSVEAANCSPALLAPNTHATAYRRSLSLFLCRSLVGGKW